MKPAGIRLSLVSLMDADRLFAEFPRPRWKGKLIAILDGEDADAVDVHSNLSIHPAEHGAAFEAVVEEMPSLRLDTPGVPVVIQRPTSDPLKGANALHGGTVDLLAACDKA